MSFISIFDVMGPNMIGPSSSHTAGAARIGFLAQKMINGPLKEVNFTLYGSFARTFKGHGTDRALLGGIMGFSTDDMRIRNSFEIAKEKGLTFSFTPNELETDIHPNTVDIHMVNNNGQEMTVRPHFAKDPSEWKNESRDFYQKEAETRTLLPSYTTYDWKQLQRMTHVEVFDYDVLGNGEKARTVLLFDYQKRDPLTGNAEMIDCSELFYA